MFITSLEKRNEWVGGFCTTGVDGLHTWHRGVALMQLSSDYSTIYYCDSCSLLLFKILYNTPSE